MNRQIKFLRTRLGRIIRHIRRKTEGDENLREVFAAPLGRAPQIRGQKQRLGDQINAVMSAVGYNLRLILKWLRKLLRLIIDAILLAIPSFSALKTAS